MALACLSSAGAPAATTSLYEAWAAARAHDPAHAAALAEAEADRTGDAQARALWLPSLVASGAAGRGSSETRAGGAQFSAPGLGASNGVDFRTSIDGGNLRRWSLGAEQPVFSAERLAAARGLRDGARAGGFKAQAAGQALMLRVAQAYFSALTAARAVEAWQRQLAAAVRARDLAAARYAAGDIPVTDSRDAQAQADLAELQLVEARNRAQLANAALADLTGADAEPTAVTGVDDAAPPASLPPLADWLRQVQDANPAQAARRAQADAAAANTQRYRAWSAPSLSLVGQLAGDHLDGRGDYGAASAVSRQHAVLLQATLPLFTGGMRSARLAEARALQRRAEAELAVARQQLDREARSVWLALGTAPVRLKAAERAEQSALARRDATRTGVAVGDRTTLELLDAEAAAESAASARLQARLDCLYARLQAAALVNALDEARFRQLAAALGPGNAAQAVDKAAQFPLNERVSVSSLPAARVDR